MTILLQALRRLRLTAFIVASLAGLLAAPAQGQSGGPGYRYQTRPSDARGIRPSRPYYYYRPRVLSRTAPETNIDVDPPSVMSRRGARIERGTRARRRGYQRRCALIPRSAPAGSSTRTYGVAPGC